MSVTAHAIDAAAVVSTVISLGWAIAGKTEASPANDARPSLLAHPWTLFLLTTALLLANQIVFSAYLLAAHGGDAGFITKYTNDYYFHIDPSFPGVQALARAFGKAGAETWLAPSLLRVNAVLELPFALFAYLSITYLFDPAAVRLLMRSALAPLGLVSFTFVLCVVEIQLYNPWTSQDLVLRAVSCLSCWLLLRRVAPPPESTPPRGVLSIGIALAGSVAIAGAVLVLYDVTLLYNMAHLRLMAMPLTIGLLAGSVGFGLVRRVDRAPARSQAVSALSSVASTLAVFFFVPSLAVRYAMHRPSGALCGLVVAIVAISVGLHRAAKKSDAGVGSFVMGLVVAVIAGAGSIAMLRSRLSHVRMPELALLAYITAAIVPALIAWHIVEAVTRRESER